VTGFDQVPAISRADRRGRLPFRGAEQCVDDRCVPEQAAGIDAGQVLQRNLERKCIVQWLCGCRGHLLYLIMSVSGTRFSFCPTTPVCAEIELLEGHASWRSEKLRMSDVVGAQFALARVGCGGQIALQELHLLNQAPAHDLIVPIQAHSHGFPVHHFVVDVFLDQALELLPPRRDAALCLVELHDPALQLFINDDLALRCRAFALHEMRHREDDRAQSQKMEERLT
jgi:hypothetical protein